MHPRATVAVLVAASGLWACNCGQTRLTLRCSTSADCEPTAVCFMGTCREGCSSDFDCADACSSPSGQGSRCRNGLCIPGCAVEEDPCASLVCELPRNDCLNATTVRRYVSSACFDGGCQAQSTPMACTNGTVCRDGTCKLGELDAGVDGGVDAGVGCSATQHLEDAGCVDNQRYGSCPFPPNTVANIASMLPQTWVDGGWEPTLTVAYDPTPSTTECRYVCASGFDWDGGVCALAGARTRCVEVRPGGNNAADWYWILPDGGVGPLRQTCPDVTRGINCSDREGCCHPAGVSINGRCVLYADQGEYCFASPQCKQPLSCNSRNVCVP